MPSIGRAHPLDRRRIVRILEANGFREVRSASHVTFKKKDAHSKVWTTWVPHHTEIAVFVIQHVIRQTGKTKEEFW